MIGALRGTLLDRDANGNVVIDVNGVGYDVQVTGTTLSKLGDPGADVFLRVHTRVREDAITLYGFITSDEKRSFDILIATHGVGPSVALALLSVYSPIELRQIVAMEDADALSKVPGIGKKTAARVLVELQTKFDIDLDGEAFNVAHTAHIATPADSARADVMTALTGLGYGTDEIREVMKTLPEGGETAELLRLALKSLAQGARS